MSGFKTLQAIAFYGGEEPEKKEPIGFRCFPSFCFYCLMFYVLPFVQGFVVFLFDLYTDGSLFGLHKFTVSS